MDLKDLEETLAGLIGEIKPLPLVRDGSTEYELILLDGTEKDHRKWLAYMAEALKTANTLKSTAGTKKRNGWIWLSVTAKFRRAIGAMAR